MENATGQYKMSDITPDQIEKTFQKKVLVLEMRFGSWTYRKPSKKALKMLSDKTGINKDLLAAQVMAADKIHFKPLERTKSDFYTAIAGSEKSGKGLTLKHADKACYTLPVVNYESADKLIRQYCIDFEAHVAEIVKNFDQIKEDAKRSLNGNYDDTLFDEKFYPSPEKLTGGNVIHRQGEPEHDRGKYYFSYKFKPYTTSNDLQAEMFDDSLKDLKSIMQSQAEQDMRSVITDIWSKIFNCLTALKNKMAEEDRQDKSGSFQSPIFRDSIIGNIKDLVNIIPSLNIFEDPAIDTARQELIKELCDIDPQELRDNKQKRQEVEKTADKILNKLPGLFGN